MSNSHTPSSVLLCINFYIVKSQKKGKTLFFSPNTLPTFSIQQQPLLSTASMKLSTVLLSGFLTSFVLASIIPIHNSVSSKSHKRPIVLWHGMGDRYDSAGIQTAVAEIKSIHKGIQVHVVRLDEDGSEDQKQTVLGVVDEQVSIYIFFLFIFFFCLDVD